MTFPGPAALGRGVVVGPGRDISAVPPLAGWPRVVVHDGALADPVAARSVADELHAHWLARRPVVVVLQCDAAALRQPERVTVDPWRLDASFELSRERLQALVWANTWDWRGDEPIWWWARKAARAGDGVEAGGPADVVLPDGTLADGTLADGRPAWADGRPAWVDGGPRQAFPAGLVDGHPVVHAESVELGVLRVVPAAGAPTAELAPDQAAAVAHAVGAARVIAPAGSGKTRVLTERLRHLIADRGFEPSTVMAVAYNTRAADEMRERTAELGAHIRTLNSLGLAIVNGTGGFAATADGRRRPVIEEVEVRRILDSLVELPRSPNTDPYVPYLDGLRAIRLGLQDPGEVEDAFEAPGLADLFDRYCKALDDRGVIDFDGQLYEALRVLLREPEARAAAQRLSRHLLVDELQDVTPAHVLVLRLLAAPFYDVFGVGDDDQVIYGYSGASPRYLIDFGRYFPGATPYALEVNYRCPPGIVATASTLLAYNARRIGKDIRAAEGRAAADGDLDVRLVPSASSAVAIADQLEAWRADGVDWTGMAALTRVNSALLPLQVVMTERGIPGRRPLDAGALERTGIRAALAYLRIGLNPGRIGAADLTDTIRRPSRRVSRKVVEMLTRRGTSLNDIRRLAGKLGGGDAVKLEDFALDLEVVIDAVLSKDTAAVIRVIRDGIGLGSAMDVLDSARREADRSTHADDLVALEQVAALHPDPATFEPWLRGVLSARGAPEPGVEVSTIHRVKGREWPGVVVFGVDRELMPHRLADDIEEERRLLHVAITRASARCVVMASVEAPSPFLAELDGTRPKTELAARALRSESGGGKFERGKGSAGSAAAVLAPEHVVEALKRWRRETAARDKVPAYVVFDDETLNVVAARGPRSLAELARCRGIGPTRLERYGDELLSVIEASLGR